MTADEFEMDWHSSYYRKRGGEWEIKVRDGDMKIEFSVYDDDVKEAFKDNIEDFSEIIRDELTDRAENAWDNGDISDEEKEIFLRILEKVRP